MNREQTKYVETGAADPRAARTKDDALGIDDIGLPEDIKPDNGRPPGQINPGPDQERNASSTTWPEQAPVAQGNSARNPKSDRDAQDAHEKPSQHDSKLERIVRKIEPTGHEIRDDDLRDPGTMTPDAPPTDNRS